MHMNATTKLLIRVGSTELYELWACWR